MFDFNSHTREGVTARNQLESRKRNFNSHTREGVTHLKLNFYIIFLTFQLTHP